MESKYYNALNEALGFDYRKLKQLWERWQSWQKAWQSIRSQFSEIDAERQWRLLEEKNIKLILISDNDYPNLLKNISGAPFGIYVQGSTITRNKKIAVVGTRKATAQGKEIAKEFSKVFSDNNLEVVSGLAYGIDTSAHEGCLEGSAVTIAVLGSGLNHIYPKQNEKLATAIAKTGTLISEYPISMPPLPHHFIERNRIVSGLSDAIVVIESPLKSGSLVTAKFALEQGKDIFVIPGNIKSENYRGSNQLIKDGAIPITEPREVLEYLNMPIIDSQKIMASLTSEEEVLYSIIKSESLPMSADELQMRTEMPIAKLIKTLTMLTIKNIIKESGGKYFL